MASCVDDCLPCAVLALGTTACHELNSVVGMLRGGRTLGLWRGRQAFRR